MNHKRKRPVHGTRSRYVSGCRKLCCRRANAAYQRAYKQRRERKRRGR